MRAHVLPSLLVLSLLVSASLAACGDDFKETKRGQVQVRVGDTVVNTFLDLAFDARAVGDPPDVKIFQIQNVAEEGDITINEIKLVTQSPWITIHHGSEQPTCDADTCSFPPLVLAPNRLEQFDLNYKLDDADLGCGEVPVGQPADWCGTVEIRTSDLDAPKITLNLRVPSLGGALQVCLETGECSSQLNMNFNSAVVGDTPQERRFTVQNVGSNVLRIKDIENTLTPVADFTLTADVSAPFTLTPNAMEEFVLTFEPQSNGATYSGSLVVKSDAAVAPSSTISVMVGNANAARIEVNPASLTFSNVNPPDSLTKELSVSNIGGATAAPLLVDFALEPSNIGVFAVFDASGSPLAGPACDVATPPSTCTNQLLIPRENSHAVQVAYTPTSTNPVTATLRVTSNDSNTPIVEVPLTGGSGFGMLVSDLNSLDWLNPALGTPESKTLTLTNEGTVAVTIDDVRTNIAPNDTLFTLSVDFAATPVTLNPTESTSVDVTFTRDANDAAVQQLFSGDVAFLHNGAGGETLVYVAVTYN